MLAPSRLFLLPPFPLFLQLVRNRTTWPFLTFPFAYSYAKLTTAEIVLSVPSQPFRFPYTLSNFPSGHLPLTHREMGATSQRIRMRCVYIHISNRYRYYCWDHSYNTGDLVDQSTRSAMAEVVEKES